MNAKGSGVDWTLRARRVWCGARWVLLALIIGYIGLVIYRIPAVREEKISQQAVAEIGAQKLTMDDVDGAHLPPPPNSLEVDATVAGVDVNGNGIRDDVELAIFAKYPTSTAIRAAELQYAMALQMYLTDVIDSQTWVAVTQQRDRAFGCLYNVSNSNYSYLEQEVGNWVLNTDSRMKSFNNAEQYRTSYKLLPGNDCDE